MGTPLLMRPAADDDESFAVIESVKEFTTQATTE